MRIDEKNRIKIYALTQERFCMSRIFTRSPLRLICFLAVICSGIAGCVLAENPLGLVSLSGNSSVITMEANDTYILTVSEVESNATILDPLGNTTIVSLQKVLPADTMSALIFLSSQSGEETVSLVKIMDPVYSAENQTFLCRITPQRYYEGTLLSKYANTSREIEPGTNAFTHIVMESPVKISENGYESEICDESGGCVTVPSSDVGIKPTTPISNYGGYGCYSDIVNGVYVKTC